MSEALIKLVEKQQLQIDALEYLMTKISLEPVIEDLDYFISRLRVNPVLESHRAVLIEMWEKINIPQKWEIY